GWLVDLLGLPAGTAAGFVTGATVANMTALAAGRHAVLHAAGWDVEADGLFGAPPITVVVGEEVHPTLVKSLGVLGLGRSRVAAVPVDGQGRMRADALPRLQGPTIVCLRSGGGDRAARQGSRRLGARRRRVRPLGRRLAEARAADGRLRGRRLVGD